GVYQYTLAISPLDCMGCNVCVTTCPTKSLKMVPQEDEAAQQSVFDYMVSEVAPKTDMESIGNVKDSQFKQPLLEFSGACAGCAETAYARLVTQVCGDRMYISNATGCSSIWGGPAATSPYTVDKKGKGPAWANSLFEDNAEHGLGLHLGQKTIRERLIGQLTEMLNGDQTPEATKALIKTFLDTKDDGTLNPPAVAALIPALEAAQKAGCPVAGGILQEQEYLVKKSTWIFGGDGWAYDIGYGGLDHVLSTGEDVNVMVFDTEVYSNTGGQASKASNIGQVAQFAAAGKSMAKKSLAEIVMQYGYVYVAQVAMGANQNQTLAAIREAEAYHGPSLVIGYSPCEMHSIKGGMQNCQIEMKKAVDCGYWNLFRFNPANKAEGKTPFTLDSKAPAGGYQEFLMNEARYSSLTRAFPERAKELFAQNEEAAKARYEHLVKLQELYK
ncbi:MAG: thiamine pyrophosphate-dependent enzyme, partial [Oscillospiraceae bacterium]